MFARATTRDDDDGDDGDARAPLERFVSEHPSVYGERVVARLSDAELLMARCASRAMRRATNAAAPERAKTLHRVRLFEDDARVDDIAGRETTGRTARMAPSVRMVGLDARDAIRVPRVANAPATGEANSDIANGYDCGDPRR